jgi:hypothetical protein
VRLGAPSTAPAPAHVVLCPPAIPHSAAAALLPVAAAAAGARRLHDLICVLCASPATSCAAAAVLTLVGRREAGAAVVEHASGERRDPGGLHGSCSAVLLPAEASSRPFRSEARHQ